jgi:hypothetical protein
MSSYFGSSSTENLKKKELKEKMFARIAILLAVSVWMVAAE